MPDEGLNQAGQDENGHDAKEKQGSTSVDRKFWTAMGLFAVLAVVIWFTVGDGSTIVFGKQIEIRWIPLFVIGTFVFRAYIAREADKIRRNGENSKL
jgi:hypothetical protein